MKKRISLALLCISLVVIFLCISCAKPTENNRETTRESTTTTSMSSTLTTVCTAPTYETVQLTPEGLLPYPVTTAISARVQKATDWTRDYLHKNKADFDLITSEILMLGESSWNVANGRNGFPTESTTWNMLSETAQHSLERIDADFRNEFDQDSHVNVGFSDSREDGKRRLSFYLETSDFTFLIHLSYFPDGYAPFREDAPYVDFGDGWYFYALR